MNKVLANTVLDTLKPRGLCADLREFERDWLGVCDRYLINYGDPSLPAYLRLYARLIETGPQQADLARDVWAHMMAKLSERRTPRKNKQRKTKEINAST